jgi:cell division protein FtsZ
VLINITGGADLTLGEVHQISEVIHDAVGEDAELIFGAVTDPAMQGEIRVTVIATGFDRLEAKEKGVIHFPQRHGASGRPSGAIPSAAMPAGGSSAPGAPGGARRVVGGTPQQAPPAASPVAEPLTDMEIPTFIRRQMD